MQVTRCACFALPIVLLLLFGKQGQITGMVGAINGTSTALDWLLLVDRELLAFATFWFCVGLLDELAIDLAWLWLKLTGRARTVQLPVGYGGEPLSGAAAVLIPAYGESQVICATIAHMLAAWPQRDLTIYVGCYRDDAPTLAAAMIAAEADPRVRLVTLAATGPTTKADCLNRLYRAMSADETRRSQRFAAVVLHDAEDMCIHVRCKRSTRRCCCAISCNCRCGPNRRITRAGSPGITLTNSPKAMPKGWWCARRWAGRCRRPG